ncbi:acyltransferase [Anaerotalea alkaliphila]|uniref:Acetyltransferase n=1 Tax=Anaerotalea alkaliphila TaxID=2662126 RepID=A0A7X5HTQ8_9FIRM|nr:DapH/DapD/GlmU-related protein [Anaerotalea alkaliphila]NDL66507.1 acetyltransferase [Anaerotalea alkaliphila]
MWRIVALILYYGIGKRLPSSDSLFSLGARGVRNFLCRRIFDSMGKGCNVERNVFFGSGKGIHLGDRSGIGQNARIQGPLHIGNDVMMGPDVLIYTRNHETARTDIPMIDQGESDPLPVVVEEDVWIGARVVLLPGVRVGRGSILGTGAVVTRDVPPYSVVGGVPARILKSRKKMEEQS